MGSFRSKGLWEKALGSGRDLFLEGHFRNQKLRKFVTWCKEKWCLDAGLGILKNPGRGPGFYPLRED